VDFEALKPLPRLIDLARLHRGSRLPFSSVPVQASENRFVKEAQAVGDQFCTVVLAHLVQTAK
jgi:hypothetical protein